MHFLSAILFAFSANMDNLPLGIAYGMRGIHIAFTRNLMIAFITSLGTLISMGLGNLITLFVSTKTATAIGSLILISIGLWFLVKSLVTKPPEDKNSEENEVQLISVKESILLALALMINNMGFGIGAKIAGLPTFLTTGCTFVCSLFLLAGGVYIGKHFGNSFLGKKSEIISGIIIIILGIYEFFI